MEEDQCKLPSFELCGLNWGPSVCSACTLKKREWQLDSLQTLGENMGPHGWEAHYALYPLGIRETDASGRMGGNPVTNELSLWVGDQVLGATLDSDCGAGSPSVNMNSHSEWTGLTHICVISSKLLWEILFIHMLFSWKQTRWESSNLWL